MEKRTCRLCFKTFCNGRALGGHMRSHMVKLQTSPPLPPPTPPTTHLHKIHLLDQEEEDDDEEEEAEGESDSSSSSPSSEDDKGLNYKLRENPKKSFRLVDPEFSSFAVDAGSIVVQDRESETESSKNPSRRRSKRSRKSGFGENSFLMMMMMHKKHKPNGSTPIGNDQAVVVVEPEPVSSVSDTTPEEDVAWCLMMLSRGITSKNTREEEVEDDEEAEDDDEEEEKAIEESEEELEEIKVRVKRSRGKYQCGTCKKFFRSYQALGGHRASHKKMKSCYNNNNNNVIANTIATPSSSSQHQEGNVVPNSTTTTINTTNAVRIHECPVCFRVFGSGQALGGHKRSHLTGGSSPSIQTPIRNTSTITTNNNTTRFAENLNFDLNLPAPIEDEDQIELSAVSDAEFVYRNHH